MAAFRLASSAAEDWAHAAQAAVTGLGHLDPEINLGFLYITDALAADARNILNYLRDRTGIRHWVGTVGMGIVAGGEEFFDKPALAVMAIALPEAQFRIFPSVAQSCGQINGDVHAWAKAAAPTFGIVHADPANPKVPGLIEEMAEQLSCFLVGAVTASRSESYQFADSLTGGGVSGILFSPEAPVATAHTQGCIPIGETHIVSEGVDNVLMELDGKRALDVFMEDVARRFHGHLEGVANQLHVALPIEGSDTGDFTVRNILGIDPGRGWVGVGCTVKPGDRVMFVSRDKDSAKTDLKAMVEKLKSRAGGRPKGAVYISCIARGPNMFMGATEVAVVREALGDVPLIGVYANGEISNNRLYGYTGVLTLFL
jgi:small ligand-binding sensory domain FIST